MVLLVKNTLKYIFFLLKWSVYPFIYWYDHTSDLTTL
jgi:hypothetical protein